MVHVKRRRYKGRSSRPRIVVFLRVAALMVGILILSQSPIQHKRIPSRLTPDQVIHLYRRTVEQHVQQQTMSWQLHYTSLYKDERTKDEMEAARQQLDPQIEALLNQRHVNRVLSSRTHHSEKVKKDNEPIVWDSDDEIYSYFNDLIVNCAKNATTEDTFQEGCFGLLEDLIWEPRCTVRLDSRYPCNGKETKAVHTVEQLISSHFMDQTVNVVIVGAGPSGLQLANALLGLGPDIRVVVFESRTSQPGRKKPYSRNWILHIESQFIHNIVDPVFDALMRVLHAPGRIQIPLNIYETLMLLSTRARGAKFVYENVLTHESLLAKIPNLVIFDATGHRLDQLGIRPVDNLVSHPWSWDPMQVNRTFFDRKMYELLQRAQILVPIAERTTLSGDKVLCPVSATGHPYRLHMLKVNDVHAPPSFMNKLAHLSYRMRSSESLLCRSKNVEKSGHSKAQHIRRWCGQLFTWSSVNEYRRDIAQGMIRHAPKDVATNVIFASLTAEQGDAMAFLMKEDEGAASAKVPSALLGELPLSLLSQADIFKQNHFDAIFKALATFPESAQTSQVNLFLYQPYMYRDPVSRGVRLSKVAPVLRVGDSLASGDTNLSTGLMFHMQVLGSFIEAIQTKLRKDVPRTAS